MLVARKLPLHFYGGITPIVSKAYMAPIRQGPSAGPLSRIVVLTTSILGYAIMTLMTPSRLVQFQYPTCLTRIFHRSTGY